MDGLSKEEQKVVDQTKVCENQNCLILKIELMISNEKYLRIHPELKLMIQKCIEQVMVEKPKDITPFLIQFFTRPDLKSFILGK